VRARRVATVTGRPLAAHYDTVLAHEHVFIDIRCWLDSSHEPSRHLRDRPVDADTLQQVRGNPFACLDNLLLDDAALMAGEVARLSGRGRRLVVDVTPQNVGRDPGGLARVSEQTGVDIVYGCGRYIAESRPGDEGLTAAQYRDEILAQFGGPPPHPAVIGEIGTGDPIADMERRSLAGAAEAQARLGVPLYVHLHPWGRTGHEALDIVERAGGTLDRVVLCHLDPPILGGLGYHRELMDRGATIAFDIWGDEYAYGHVRMPTDQERLAALVTLVGDGYGDRIVHSQDVCTKTQLHAFGGAGFDHLPRVVAPLMATAGLPAGEVHRHLAGNALSLLHPAERTS
jgi:phosphotriesterase-related protein